MATPKALEELVPVPVAVEDFEDVEVLLPEVAVAVPVPEVGIDVSDVESDAIAVAEADDSAIDSDDDEEDDREEACVPVVEAVPAVPEAPIVVAGDAEVVEDPAPAQLKPMAQHTASESEFVVQYSPLAHNAPFSLQQTNSVGS